MSDTPSASPGNGRGENTGKKALLLRGEGLSIRFGAHSVLHGVDIIVSADEIVTLIGPNGAGKTTLIRVLLGLIAPTTGVVWRSRGLTVGYVPQRLAIDPVLPLTVARLMTLTVRLSPAEIAAGLKETGVGHLAEASVHALSGGELQRVLLARALVRRPQLLVLDEPVQGVDYTGEAALYELITTIRYRRGCGVLMVSHDLHVVMAATDRVICLNRHVCCSGTPDAVERHPEYVRLFGRRGAQAVALYAHQHDHRHGLGGEVVKPGQLTSAEPDTGAPGSNKTIPPPV